jgi:hypothetical protein
VGQGISRFPRPRAALAHRPRRTSTPAGAAGSGPIFLEGLLIGVLQTMSTHNVKMEATEQEWQMVEAVREREADTTSDFRLLVQRQDGAGM